MKKKHQDYLLKLHTKLNGVKKARKLTNKSNANSNQSNAANINEICTSEEGAELDEDNEEDPFEAKIKCLLVKLEKK